MTPTEAAAMPVLYLSHGAPPLADDARWTRELRTWSADLPRPTSILVVSAHWEHAPLAVERNVHRAAAVRLLGLPAAVLRGHV